MTPSNYRNLQSGASWLHFRPWAICRWNLRLIFRRKLCWLLIALGLLHFLLFFALIYAKAQFIVQNPGMSRIMDRFFVTGTGEAYRDFLSGQAQAVMILLAYAGVVLVQSDFQLGGVAFYLSLPIGKTQYLLGKAMALWVLIGMLTLVPGYILFAAYGLFANSLDYWWENPQIAVGIGGYSVIIMSSLSLLTLAVAASCRTSSGFVMTWTAIFFLLRPLSELLRRVFDSPHWQLLNLWRSIRIAGEMCFGKFRYEGEWSHTKLSAIILVTVCTISFVVLLRRVRPVEIVK